MEAISNNCEFIIKDGGIRAIEKLRRELRIKKLCNYIKGLPELQQRMVLGKFLGNFTVTEILTIRRYSNGSIKSRNIGW